MLGLFLFSRKIQNLLAQTSRLAAATAVSAGRIGAVTAGLLRCIEAHALLRERLEKMALEVITSEQVIKNIAIGSRVFDGGGLYLIAAKTSTRLHGWRFDYTFEGKRKTISLGTYPKVDLKMARERASEARKQVAVGINPSELRKQKRAVIVAKLEAERRVSEAAGYRVIRRCGTAVVRDAAKRLDGVVYPLVSLEEARALASQVRQTLTEGHDPSMERKLYKAALRDRREAERRFLAGEPAKNCFEDVARRWYATRAPDWMDSYGSRVLSRLERLVFPCIGKKPIAELQPPELLEMCRRIEARGTLETVSHLQ